MLVLTRRVGEELLIGGTIRIKVLKINGKYVKIGIEAPTEVRVNRPDMKKWERDWDAKS